MYKFLVIAATLPLLAVTESLMNGGHSTGSSAGSVYVSTQYGAPTFGSGVSSGFGSYQFSQQTAQGFGGQGSYNSKGDHGQRATVGYNKNGGFRIGGAGGFSGGGEFNGFSHGSVGRGNGFGKTGSIGHSIENGGGAPSLYRVPGLASSLGHLGSTSFHGLYDFSSSPVNMPSLPYGDPHFVDSHPMFGNFRYKNHLSQNGATDYTGLIQFGGLPSQFFGAGGKELFTQFGLPLSTSSTKNGPPTTDIRSSKYGVPYSSPSTTNSVPSFEISSTYGVPYGRQSIKAYGGSSSQQYGTSSFGSTSKFGEASTTPSLKYGEPSVDFTTSGGLSSSYGVPSLTHDKTSSTYGRPSFTYSAPSSGLPTSYGAPFIRAPTAYHGTTNALSSGGPSSTYGIASNLYDAPSAPSTGPSSQYCTSSKASNGPSNSYALPSMPSSGPSISYGVLSIPFSGPSTSYGEPTKPFSGSSKQYGISSKGLASSSTGQTTQYGVPTSSHY